MTDEKKPADSSTSASNDEASKEPEETTEDSTTPSSNDEASPSKEEASKEKAPAEDSEEKTEEAAPSEDETEPASPNEDEVEEVKVEVAPEVDVRPGYTVKLHLRINDGKKERIQIFEGIVLDVSGKTPETRTITVRKESKGFGVEKIVPLAMPSLEKVEVVKTAKVRRATLSYIKGYKKRLKETAR